MKGIILAGGKGTRLLPLTKIIHKHLLPVGKYPMIYYSVMKMKEAGIDNIMLVTGREHIGMYSALLGGGSEWGLNFTYRIQEEAGGIAQALGLGETFIAPGEKFLVLLGDNIFSDSLKPHVDAFVASRSGTAKVFLKQVPDPRRYGVPELLDEKIVRIEEKPDQPQSPYCVTGIYMYDDTVFHWIKQIRPSARGEFEITDVNNAYASRGNLYYSILQGWWTDAGTFGSLYETSGRLLTMEDDEQ